MTKKEIIMILAELRGVYPHSFNGLSERDYQAIINLWHRQFEEYDSKVVSAAVDALIAVRTEGFSPTPGEVKEQIRKIKGTEELDELSAWALVSKACANGIYGYREEFAKLPEAVQRAVGAPEQLREWAMMESETVQSVVASNFQRTYRVRQARERELEMLPQNVRALIGGDMLRLK